MTHHSRFPVQCTPGATTGSAPASAPLHPSSEYDGGTWSGNAPVLWLKNVIRAVARLLGVGAVPIARPPFDLHELGAVSDRWIAAHRVDLL
jgi:hypothetical protein